MNNQKKSKRKSLTDYGSCKGKVAYINKKEALNKRNRKLTGPTLYAYKCEECKLWHRTSVSPGYQKQIRKRKKK